MDINPELSEKIQELQIIERNLQGFAMEKQSFQVELNEITNALTELSKSGDEVYKILGGLMIKSEKNSLSKDLNDKKKILELRISSVEKQEKSIEEKSDKLRKEINAKMIVKAK